jgi:LAS superfamily LD-carboxypeptidase LdcB
MGSCNNDKLKSFLTKPKARNKKRNADSQTTQENNENRLRGKTFFVARVISKPLDLAEPQIVTGYSVGLNGSTFHKQVRIRLQDYNANGSISDPLDAPDAEKCLQNIYLHPTALSTDGELKLGDLVTVRKEAPIEEGVGDSYFTVVEKIAEDERYFQRFQDLFEGGGFIQTRFAQLSGDAEIQAKIAQLVQETEPDEGFYKDGDVQVKNGELPRAILQYVKNKSGKIVQSAQIIYDEVEILFHYTSSDKAGGLCFVKDPNATFNYADQLIELAKAYRAAAHTNNWEKKYMNITSAFRSYEKQLYLEATQPAFSAEPGTSNHGWAIAFDWGVPGVPRKQLGARPEFTWMFYNAPQYQFFAKGMDFTKQEPWHFEIIGGRDFYYGIQ